MKIAGTSQDSGSAHPTGRAAAAVPAGTGAAAGSGAGAVAAAAGAATPGYDVERVRRDFPGLQQQIHGKDLVYLDNAATTQKPQAVIDAVVRFYRDDCANVHRGVHLLSTRATEAFEGARRKVQRLINAGSPREIVFVRGATEAINLVAQSWGRSTLRPGDEILISAMEHHSNIVPWQMVCQQTGATLRVAPIDDRGQLIVEEYEKLLSPRTRLVAMAWISNSLGTVNPVRHVVETAHAAGALVLFDAAQAAPHTTIDVRALDCDFLALSSHKMYGPTGVGVVFGKTRLLEAMPPWQGGGEMIRSVTFEHTVYNDLPGKFEAGTPDIAGVIGLGAAVDYLQALGLQAIAAHEHRLLDQATAALRAIPGVRLVGTAADKAAVLSFTVEGVHPHDVGTVLDLEGVAVRTGHHCAQPVMDRFGVPATARASFGLYNTMAEVDALARGVARVREVFGA